MAWIRQASAVSVLIALFTLQATCQQSRERQCDACRTTIEQFYNGWYIIFFPLSMPRFLRLPSVFLHEMLHPALTTPLESVRSHRGPRPLSNRILLNESCGYRFVFISFLRKNSHTKTSKIYVSQWRNFLMTCNCFAFYWSLQKVDALNSVEQASCLNGQRRRILTDMPSFAFFPTAILSILCSELIREKLNDNELFPAHMRWCTSSLRCKLFGLLRAFSQAERSYWLVESWDQQLWCKPLIAVQWG